MRRESHVRFCEGGGVRFLSATRLVGDVDVSPYQGETGVIVWRREGVLFQRAFLWRAIMNPSMLHRSLRAHRPSLCLPAHSRTASLDNPAR